MSPSISKKFASLAAVFVMVVLFRTATLAEPTKVEGVIVGRSGNEIIVEFMQGTELAFLLDESTKVSQTGGLFKARRTDKSMAALIDLVRSGRIAPGSRVLYAHLGGQPALNAYAGVF